MNTPPVRSLAIVGRSSTGLPRTFRVQSTSTARHPDAAYRQLAATIVGVDVATLVQQLRFARLAGPHNADRAA